MQKRPERYFETPRFSAFHLARFTENQGLEKVTLESS
jgi:hypothetical protein